MRTNFALDYVHRDKMLRPIRGGDIVVWTNAKKGSHLQTGVVINATSQRIKLQMLEVDKTRIVSPDNCVVITQQLLCNVDDNVGASMRGGISFEDYLFERYNYSS